MLMLAFVRVRRPAGFVGGTRQTEPRVARLWSDHAAGASVVAALVLMLPGWIA